MDYSHAVLSVHDLLQQRAGNSWGLILPHGELVLGSTTYYHMCRPLQTRWRSSGGRLYQPGVASWGVGEVMNDTPLVLKGCMTVVALSLILQYIVHSWSKLRGRSGGGKVCCHWQGSTSQVKGSLDGGDLCCSEPLWW